MKKISVISLFLLLALSLSAQRNPQTLLGGGAEFTTGFGGFMLQFPPIKGSLTAMTGGGGAVLINNTFYIGGYGMSLADDVQVISDTTTFDVDHNHGGLMFGYLIKPESLVHVGIGTKVGWGEVSLRQKPEPNISYSRIRDRVFVVSPQVEVEVNMTDWFKFNVGVGYQLTNGVDNFYYQNGDLDGMTLSASFLFGWFR